MRAVPAPAVLVCRCGTGLSAGNMRRLPRLLELPTAGVVLDPIVCPGCVDVRLREIAALNADPQDEPELGRNEQVWT